MKVFMLEDDNTISFAVKTFLKKQDIDTDVFSSIESTENIDINNYDLLILDVNLGDGSGFDFLEYTRSFSQIPTIMLTVKGDDKYIIKGLEYGADDYIVKPFSLPVLKARIENVMRRGKLDEDEEQFNELHLIVSSKTAEINGKNLGLSPQEFDILNMLIKNKDINISRARIIDHIWGRETKDVNDNTLTVTVKRLRSKLGKYGKYIKTVRGIGYLWDSEKYEE